MPEVDYGYEDRLITRLDLRAVIAKSLSDREKRILRACIQGYTFREIGAQDGVCGKRAAQIYARAVRRLKFKATGKREVEPSTNMFGQIIRERITPEAIPQVIPPSDNARMMRNLEAQTAVQTRLFAWSPPPRSSYQPLPWMPGHLARDRIILSVYGGRGLIKRHHTECAAFAADIRDMMKIGDRIEVLADGISTMLVLGDKWRLIEPSH